MLEFTATLVKLPGKIAWTVFYIPAAFTDTLGTKGRITVRAVVDGAEFPGTLLPSSNGYYQVYNQAMREHCGKEIGGTVHVLLDIDNQPRELALSEDVLAALTSSAAAMEKFTALPYYLRREEINKINAAKTLPTREKLIIALLEKLVK
ncbi:MAG TPA: DUF1905 domain-containing protein [Armatimonadota bacterium]